MDLGMVDNQLAGSQVVYIQLVDIRQGGKPDMESEVWGAVVSAFAAAVEFRNRWPDT